MSIENTQTFFLSSKSSTYTKTAALSQSQEI